MQPTPATPPIDADAEVRRRIAERDKITFAEFMDIALYWPNGGFYTRADTGPDLDYLTSPATHPAFGALLSVQLYQGWQNLGAPETFTVVEQGAGSGLLARDIMAYAAYLPGGFAEALRYLCIDRSSRRRLEKTLPEGLRRKVERATSETLPVRGIIGCILSNELPDAFPVHVVEIQAGRLLELHVTLSGDKLAEVLATPSTPEIERHLADEGITLVEGQRAEVNLRLDPWMAQVAGSLERGYVITIDYGDVAERLYGPERKRGTLNAFYRHTHSNLYQRVGRQDLTAFVDFTALARAGEHHGLTTAGLTSQRAFLRRLGLAELTGRLRRLDLSRAEEETERVGMLALRKQGGLGDFGVLVQVKEASGEGLWGLDGGLPSGLSQALPVPRLTPHHVRVHDGTYRPPEYGAEIR